MAIYPRFREPAGWHTKSHLRNRRRPWLSHNTEYKRVLERFPGCSRPNRKPGRLHATEELWGGERSAVNNELFHFHVHKKHALKHTVANLSLSLCGVRDIIPCCNCIRGVSERLDIPLKPLQRRKTHLKALQGRSLTTYVSQFLNPSIPKQDG